MGIEKGINALFYRASKYRNYCLSCVSKLTIPLLGTVPDHHAELLCPLWAGSSAFSVSPIFEPVILTGRPPRKIRLAKVSFTLLVFWLFFLSGNYFGVVYRCTRIPLSKQKFINALQSLDLILLYIHHKLLLRLDLFCNKNLHLVLNSE